MPAMMCDLLLVAEALERAQQLAAEKVRERQRVEQDQLRMRASHAASHAGTSVDTAKPAGAFIMTSCTCCRISRLCIAEV